MLRALKDLITGKRPRGARRSSQWRAVRAAHLKENPCCIVCGSTSKLEVHHIRPFHEAPEDELKRSNLATLCEGRKSMNCHLEVGHRGNYRLSNPNVLADAAFWRGRLEAAA